MSIELQKPIIGFTCGDLNGIGMEIVIKTLCDHRILEFCVPVLFANNKSINFYRKTLPDHNFVFTSCKDLTKLHPKQINVFHCWEEEVAITPGELNEIGGSYALKSLTTACKALKEGLIHCLVTAPIHKKNIQSKEFNYTGHTPYLRDYFNAKDVVMFMVAENMKVALVTEHVSIAEIAKQITKDAILSKLKIMNESLIKDFAINKPRIAVLGLNPHAGDEGLIGNEEETIIKPAILEAKKDILVYGPYSADAFFAKGNHEKFDAVLAMYHDQGLIPFKSLSLGEGLNYTAGMSVVRTSPDHGTAFDIAGKGIANHESTMEALFKALEIDANRIEYKQARLNPMKKLSDRFFSNTVDEKLEESEA